MTNDEVIAQGLRIRDEIAAIKKRHTEELLPFVNALAAAEQYLFVQMVQSKQLNIKTAKGTAYQAEKIETTIGDRDALIGWVLEPIDTYERVYVGDEIRQRLAVFTNHIAKEHVKDLMDAGSTVGPDGQKIIGPPPPGVKVDRSLVCHIRKP